MFKVKDPLDVREQRIRALLNTEPQLAVVLACVNLEWLIRRAVVSLSPKTNREVRDIMKRHRPSGLQGYKEIWKELVSSQGEHPSLALVVSNWENLLSAAHLRNKLMHGIYSCGPDYAREKTEVVLLAAHDLTSYCEKRDVNLGTRLKVKRTSNKYSPENQAQVH